MPVKTAQKFDSADFKREIMASTSKEPEQVEVAEGQF